MSKFLENLKNAVETGEFNSDAAKRINEINDLANKKIGEGYLNDKDINLDSAVEYTESEDAIEKLKELKLQDEINNEVANLHNLENNLLDSFREFRDTLVLVEEKYKDHLEDLKYSDLFSKIEELKSKFSF
jgi:hypothetical protein